MASKKTLNAKNLEALGATRLAELLIEISTGDAAAKRRLRLELAGEQGAGDVAREVRKRLTTIARSRTFVDWRNRKPLTDDLETQRRAIVERVAVSDPAEALDLLWRFLEIADPVFARCDDGSGRVIAIFHQATRDLGTIAARAVADPVALAERAFNALNGNEYGQYDGLIAVLAPALGPSGLDHMKARFVELGNAPLQEPSAAERRVVGWSSAGPIHADEIAARHRDLTVRIALRDIADAQGDVDGFIALHSDDARAVPKVATEIAERLLAAGRAEEAWTAINAIDTERPGWIPFEWEETRIAVLEALGRGDEAQAFRWACFERSLDLGHLRAHLDRLPDFEDVDAEDRAIAYALSFHCVHRALAFLISWPRLDEAARLVVERLAELDGDHYEVLAPAAKALAEKHPLAATLVLRTMIDFALDAGRVKRYRHAARHLATCASLCEAIDDYGAAASHEAYLARLRERHGRKSSFWSLTA
jgi:hypothetical protein